MQVSLRPELLGIDIRLIDNVEDGFLVGAGRLGGAMLMSLGRRARGSSCVRLKSPLQMPLNLQLFRFGVQC